MISKRLFTTALISVSMIPAISFAVPNDQDIPFKFEGDEDEAVQDNPIAVINNNVTSKVDEMFRNFFNNGGLAGASQQIGNNKFLPFSNNPFESANIPKTDIVKRNDKIEVSVELPGIEKDKIDLHIAPGFLTVSYKEEVKKESKDKDYMMSERRVGAVRRVIPLPYGADIEKAKAKYKNGVVYISVPTMDDAKFKPHKIEIE